MDDTGDNNKIRMDVHQILPLIGEYGRFQRFLDVLFCFMNFPLTYQLLIMYFVTLDPPWKCISNSTICNLNGTMSSHDTRRCSMPRNEWDYTEPRTFSLVTEFDINCKKEWLSIVVHSVFFIGWGTGAVLLGWLGDKYGRKIVLFPSIGIILVVGFCTAFMPSIYLIIVCRFVIGFFITGGTLQMFIIMSEIVGNKYRAFAGIIIYIFGSVALCVLILKAYFIRNWKLLNTVCTAPYIFILAFYKITPESVQWLQEKGRSDEAMRIIRQIAHWNRRELPNNITILTGNHSDKANPLDLFRTCEKTTKTLIQGFIWMATTTCFYCLYLAADDLGGSPYRDQFILIATEIPSVFSTVYCINRFGRKPTTLISLLLGGVACLALAFIPARNNDLKIGRVICGMLGKFAIATALNCLYTWSFELFPTNIRAEGMGLLQITAHIGSGSAPWISKGMYSLGKGAPFIVMGVPALISAALGLVLPETKSKGKVDTSEENQTKDTRLALQEK